MSKRKQEVKHKRPKNAPKYDNEWLRQRRKADEAKEKARRQGDNEYNRT